MTLKIVLPIVIYHAYYNLIQHCHIGTTALFLNGVFEKFILFSVFIIFNLFYIIRSAGPLLNICGRAFFVVVLRCISGLYLLMWKPLTLLSNSLCGQFLKDFLFLKAFDRCVLSLDRAIRAICCININTIGIRV